MKKQTVQNAKLQKLKIKRAQYEKARKLKIKIKKRDAGKVTEVAAE